MRLRSGRGIEGSEVKRARRARKESLERGEAPDHWYWIQFSVFKHCLWGGLMIINEISVQLQGRAGEKGEPGLTVCTILIITLKRNQHQATFK